MHLECSSSLTLVAILIVTFISITLNNRKKSSSVCQNLPPGPKKLPIIGDLHRMSAVPYHSFRDLAGTYGPLMHLKLGEVSVVIVSSPDLARSILKERDPCFAGRPPSIATEIVWYNYVSIAFSDYSEYWRQMKKICVVQMLSPKNVRSFGYIRNEEVSRIVQSIELLDGKPVNLTEKIFSMVSSITCRAAFGKVCKDRDKLIALVNDTLGMASGFCASDLFPSWKIVRALDWSKPKLVKMRRELDVILDDIINQHKANLANSGKESREGCHRRGNGEFGSEDFVDVLLKAKDQGELNFPIGNDNIKGVLFDMFGGGTETASASIDWTMTELLRNPGVMAKAQAEVREHFRGKEITEENDVQNLKYLKLVVKESLRLHPPIPILPRQSREDASINGYYIPAKTTVLVNHWAIHRDPKYWTDPERFEPERFENSTVDYTGGDFEYLPFGAGKRMCPGMTYGLASIALPLAQLLYKFNWKLPEGVDPKDLNMMETFGLAAARTDNLVVIATPYESLAA